MSVKHEISKFDDSIDVRDVIARFEELESQKEDATLDEFETEELTSLKALLDALKGKGGDEQWRGDWYPISLIHDSYFKEYAQELANDTGAIDSNAEWPNNCINWDKATKELQADYSTVKFGKIIYWYRQF
jgi:hypothetical protein